MKELWKNITFLDEYQVSSLGRVRSTKCNKIVYLRPATSSVGGYLFVTLWNNDTHKPKSFCVHRLVWISFIGMVPKGFEIDHINRDRKDNSLTNLRLATRAENGWNSKPKRGRDIKGVYYEPEKSKSNPWCAKFTVNRKRIHLGVFPSKEDAIKAYNTEVVKYHGDFSVLN